MGFEREWEAFGAREPFHSVLTDDAFLAKALDDRALLAFFSAGRADVQRIRSAALSLDATFAPQSFLDYGCGVGRMLVWVAAECEHAVGVDVSRPMLAHASYQIKERGLNNVELMHPADFAQTTALFDWVNCYLVLQHIPTLEGLRVLDALLQRVNSRGFISIHVPYWREGGMWRRFGRWLRRTSSVFNKLVNRSRGTEGPYMQMNAYPISKVFAALQKGGFSDARAIFTDHGGILGILIVAGPRTGRNSIAEGAGEYA